MCKRTILIAATLTSLLTLPLLAAPLQLMGTSTNLTIEGRAFVGAPTLPVPSTYKQSTSSGGIGDTHLQLSAAVTAGNQPGVESSAGSNALGGVDFQQIASNEYILTLSARAGGKVIDANRDAFTNGDFSAMSQAHLQADFRVLGTPVMPQGQPATVILHLEHAGDITSRNLAHASSKADLSVRASTSFEYHKMLSIMSMPTFGFDEIELHGTRDFAQDAVIQGYTGGTISITADLMNTADGMLTRGDVYSSRAADSDFESGLRLHMLVLPEPATAGLLALGATLLLRRRRSA